MEFSKNASVAFARAVLPELMSFCYPFITGLSHVRQLTCSTGGHWDFVRHLAGHMCLWVCICDRLIQYWYALRMANSTPGCLLLFNRLQHRMKLWNSPCNLLKCVKSLSPFVTS